ncbi:hypothetical protein HanIR_Chr14g0712791 [Helianthus annuus]|nr:hypothetical protein HanIR_Chr14g0712791 [Helianthus annuus]
MFISPNQKPSSGETQSPSAALPTPAVTVDVEAPHPPPHPHFESLFSLSSAALSPTFLHFSVFVGEIGWKECADVGSVGVYGFSKKRMKEQGAEGGGGGGGRRWWGRWFWWELCRGGGGGGLVGSRLAVAVRWLGGGPAAAPP